MIEVKRDENDITVMIAGNEVEILDAGNDHILVECELSDLADEASQPLLEGLVVQIHSSDGFGTYFFHDLELSSSQDGTVLAFRCHTPNKYWEGRFGLATFLAAIKDQVEHYESWKVSQIELEDDWKGITLERIVAIGDPLQASILAGAEDLQAIIHSAEVSLSGLPWKDEFLTKRVCEKYQNVFCFAKRRLIRLIMAK